MARFFVNPFGVDGDRTAVPTSGSITGSMSYEFGFTPNYQLDLANDPAALPVPRGQTNQVYYDITDALKQYQTTGTPDWITSVDNLGSPYAYDIYARVRYDAGGGMEVYENLVDGNTQTPGSDASWMIISGNAAGVPTGTVIDFAGITPPTGYLNCDGSAVTRATYVNLHAAITMTQNGTTTNTTNSLTGLTSTADMYIGMPLEGADIPAGTTVATIVNGTEITMSQNASASGTVPVTFYPWGNGNGTTTFNVPDFRRRVSMGSGGSASTDPLGVGNKVGQTGGQEGHVQTVGELAAHSHTIAGGGSTGSFDHPFFDSPASDLIETSSTTGSSNAMNVIQPSAIMRKCIRT